MPDIYTHTSREPPLPRQGHYKRIPNGYNINIRSVTLPDRQYND